MVKEEDLIFKRHKEEFGKIAYERWCKEWNEARELVLKYLPKDRVIPIVCKEGDKE